MKIEECAKCRDEVVWFALFSNSFLTFFKAALGIIAGSAALVADSLHSFADVVANIATIASLKISSRPPDDNHPYGHGHVQFMATALVGLLLVGGGIYILIGAIKAIASGRIESPSWIAMLGALISIVLNELVYRYEDCVGKKNNCPAIIADAWDNRSDALSSLGVLIGVALSTLGYPLGDPLAAVGVGIIVVKIGVQLTIEAINGLMDASPEVGRINDIERLATSVYGVLGVKLVRARLVGEDLHVDIEVLVEGNRKVYEGDLIADYLATRISTEVEHVAEVQVFLAPSGTARAEQMV